MAPALPLQGGRSAMSFWVTPTAPGRSRITLHMASTKDLPPPLKFMVTCACLPGVLPGLLAPRAAPILPACAAAPPPTAMQTMLPPWVDHVRTRSAVFDGDNVFLRGQDALLAQHAQQGGATWRK